MLQFVREKGHLGAFGRGLTVIGATKGLAFVIDLFEKRRNLFNLFTQDNAVLLDLLYRKQPASIERVSLFRA